jgi:hypothetical protein
VKDTVHGTSNHTQYVKDTVFAPAAFHESGPARLVLVILLNRNFTLGKTAATSIYPFKNREAGREDTFTMEDINSHQSEYYIRAETVLLENYRVRIALDWYFVTHQGTGEKRPLA